MKYSCAYGPWTRGQRFPSNELLCPLPDQWQQQAQFHSSPSHWTLLRHHRLTVVALVPLWVLVQAQPAELFQLWALVSAQLAEVALVQLWAPVSAQLAEVALVQLWALVSVQLWKVLLSAQLWEAAPETQAALRNPALHELALLWSALGLQ